MSGVFVLIHSPFVGPSTWTLVADALEKRGASVVVPRLTSPPDLDLPYWARHVDEVVKALGSTADSEPLVLVAHSGAGALLPVISQRLRGRVIAYLFVDAGIPEDGKSRLDLFESPDAVDEFRRAASGGLLPVWTDEDLRDIIPNAEIRDRFVAELRPLPLAVYEEPIPVPHGWPDAPCGYLRFGANPAYDATAAHARQEGWAYRELDGGHFLMLVEPESVAKALLDFASRLEFDPKAT